MAGQPASFQLRKSLKRSSTHPRLPDREPALCVQYRGHAPGLCCCDQFLVIAGDLIGMPVNPCLTGTEEVLATITGVTGVPAGVQTMLAGAGTASLPLQVPWKPNEALEPTATEPL